VLRASAVASALVVDRHLRALVAALITALITVLITALITARDAGRIERSSVSSEYVRAP